MAAVEVHDTATDAAGQPAPLARVTISLFASVDGRGAGVVTTQERTVVASYHPTVNATTGHWAINLEPNANILPVGTVYAITTQAPAEKARVQYIAVPDDDSIPHWVGSILADMPGSFPSAPLSIEIANREAALLAEEIARVDADIAEAGLRIAGDADTLDSAIAYTDSIAFGGTGGMIPLAQKGAANGVAELDGSGLLLDAEIPTSIARDSEVVPVGSDRWLRIYAAAPDKIAVGAVTRDADEAATSAAVVWPDGTVGTYTATTVSSAFPGAVDAYSVTYGSPVTKTVTQPTVTRDAFGAITNRPALVVT